MKTLRVTLDIVVADLSKDERDEIIEMEEELYGEPYLEELPVVEDYESYDIAKVFDDADSETTKELFAGTGIFVQFDSIKVISSDWVE
jgi:hypothetical protein